MGEKQDKLRELRKETAKIVGEIPKQSKHVLWNYDISPDNFDNDQNPYTRFYFAIVDNRYAYRETTRRKLIDILSEQNSGIVHIGGDVQFPIKGSRWELLFVVYDARRTREDLNFYGKGIIAKRDPNFRKKDVLQIEDYLRTRYT